jgi:hypothetical protein
MHRGLPVLQWWLVLVEVKFDTNTTGGSPSPKLDRYDPKHSHIDYTYTNDAMLNMMKWMP